jgi:hypothetical protein
MLHGPLGLGLLDSQVLFCRLNEILDFIVVMDFDKKETTDFRR